MSLSLCCMPFCSHNVAQGLVTPFGNCHGHLNLRSPPSPRVLDAAAELILQKHISHHFLLLVKMSMSSTDLTSAPSPANMFHGALFTLAGLSCLPPHAPATPPQPAGLFCLECPQSLLALLKIFVLTSLHPSAEPSEYGDDLSVLVLFLEIF